MNVETGVGYDQIYWIRLNEFSPFSTMPPRRKLWNFPDIDSIA